MNDTDDVSTKVVKQLLLGHTLNIIGLVAQACECKCDDCGLDSHSEQKIFIY